MSRSISQRLANLERASAPEICPMCHLDRDGWPVPMVFGQITFDLHTEPTPRPAPTPCEQCGRVPAWFTLKIGERPIEFDGDKEINQ